MKNNDLFALKKFIEDFGIELKEEIRENSMKLHTSTYE